MKIRKTTPTDISAVAEIYENARQFMRESGNPNQWIGRPNEEDVRRDVENGNGYVVVDNEEIIGAFYFSLEPDPTYLRIDDGEWINDDPYAVIHRIAVKHHGREIANFVYT